MSGATRARGTAAAHIEVQSGEVTVSRLLCLNPDKASPGKVVKSICGGESLF